MSEQIPNRYTTQRGFHVYDDFKDAYNNEIKVYESSAASGPHVWIGIEGFHDNDSPDEFQAAHLNVEQAKRIRDALDTFLKEIPTRWENGNEEI